MSFYDIIASYTGETLPSSTAPAASKTYEQKAILLRSLYDQMESYKRSKNKDDLDQYEQEVKIQVETARIRARLLDTLVKTKGKLSETQLQVAQRDAANLRDNVTKLTTNYDSRAAGWLSRVVGQVPPGTAPDAAREYIFRTLNQSWDMRSPATPYLFGLLSDKYSEGTVRASAPELASAADSEMSRQQGLAQVVNNPKFDILPEMTSKDVDEYVKAISDIQIEPPALPGEPDLKTDQFWTDMDNRRSKLESDLFGGDAAGGATMSRSGLTREQEVGILSDPKFKKWASSNGFVIGEASPKGGYAPGPDDIRAMQVASRQIAGLPTLPTPRRRNPELVRVDVGEAPTATWSFDGEGSAYGHDPDGSVSKVDLTTGDVTKVKSASGDWSDIKAKSAYEQIVAAASPSPVGPKDGAAVSIEGLVADVKAGKPILEEYTANPSELLIPSGRQVHGKRLPVRAGEDPDEVLRVSTEGGPIVLDMKDGRWVAREPAKLDLPGVTVLAGGDVKRSFGNVTDEIVGNRSERRARAADPNYLVRGADQALPILPPPPPFPDVGEEPPVPVVEPVSRRAPAPVPPDRLVNPITGTSTPMSEVLRRIREGGKVEAPVRIAPPPKAEPAVIYGEGVSEEIGKDIGAAVSQEEESPRARIERIRARAQEESNVMSGADMALEQSRRLRTGEPVPPVSAEQNPESQGMKMVSAGATPREAARTVATEQGLTPEQKRELIKRLRPNSK